MGVPYTGRPITMLQDALEEALSAFMFQYKGMYFGAGATTHEAIDFVESMEIFDDDVFIVTYPKSGTIWTQQILSLILYEGRRNGSESINTMERAPWIEYHYSKREDKSRASRRLFTSHLPFYLMPRDTRFKKGKIIYVYRNPKDVLVSFYHFHKAMGRLHYDIDWDTFFGLFMSGRVMGGSWFDHIIGWYTHKQDYNILFMAYEEMQKDLKSAVLKLCKFVDVELDDQAIETVVEKATFKNMKQDPLANYEFVPKEILDFDKCQFLRKGLSKLRAGPPRHFFWPAELLQNRSGGSSHHQNWIQQAEQSGGTKSSRRRCAERLTWTSTLRRGVSVIHRPITMSRDALEEALKAFMFNYKGVYFESKITNHEFMDSVETMEIRDDDVFIVTYPKSGTIWTQQILSLILYEGHRNGSDNITTMERAPWIEYNYSKMDYEGRTSPRLFSSHLPYYLMPRDTRLKKVKIVYVYRNPKDILVSYHHFYKAYRRLQYDLDWDTFFDLFMSGRVIGGSWFDHIIGWNTHKQDYNILFMSYEEMQKDLKSAVLKLCKFVDVELDDRAIETVVEKATFKNMKQDPLANYESVPKDVMDFEKCKFLRKGKVGDWKNLMTVAQNEEFDRVYKEKIGDLPIMMCWGISNEEPS